MFQPLWKSVWQFLIELNIHLLFPGGSEVKASASMWETQVQSLGREDPQEKEMAIHSSTIVWKISWTEEPGRLQSMGSQRVGHDWAISLSLSHTSKVMLKILQARIQQYMNHELPDVQAGFRKAEEPEIKLPTSAGSSKKQESSRKTSISALLTMPKPSTVWITINCEKFWKWWGY